MEYTLITGASSGVGRELAVYLSKTYKLILNGRNEERLIETKSMCEGDTIIWPYDLENIQSIEAELSLFMKENEVSISQFVHCAGLMKMVPIRAVNVETLNSTYGVNVFAPVLITKTIASRKINARNLKSVVFISSNISNRGAAAFSVYGSSKAALDGLMITEMTKDIFNVEEKRAEFERNYPLGIGTPNDIAPTVNFLLSDDSRWITGQQFIVDGGRTVDITERSK